MMQQPTPADTNPRQQPPRENVWLNLLLNIIIPTLILTKGSKEEYLGPTLGLIVALAFPIGYGIYDYFRARKVNLFSVLGIISVLLTGGISLLKLPPEYIAIKEASIPALIGLFCLISIYTPWPLVRTVLYNRTIMQVDRVNQALHDKNNMQRFEQVLKNATYLLSGSFFLSAVLNYVLATVIVVSAPGTEQYNEELGKMMALSYPVIALPCTLVMAAALYYLYHNITKLTHLELGQIIIQPETNTKD